MPIHVEVDPNQPDLFRWTITGKWTLDEYYLHNNEVLRKVKELAPLPTYAIADVTQSNTLPPQAIGMLPATVSRAPENWAKTVIVIQSEFILSLFQIAVKARPMITKKFEIASTMQEAEAMIQAHRAIYQ